ncbi:casein kinase II, regulatory subunit [Lipomyces oligophaga]|uniref:casein kinase II, regulatory subunit n=1 Tax=Lipomyces oligophaga TaxID=45792 RepID=UPI0034CF3E57
MDCSSESDYTKFWIDWFLATPGNDFFCEIDDEFLSDRFNMTGLNSEVQYYQYAMDLVMDSFEYDFDEQMREQIERSAIHLYGLIHARYILTQRGLQKMLDKYKNGDFGYCPRTLCEGHPVLPVGLTDVPHTDSVKVFCIKCEDIYNPAVSRYNALDGAYFGTSFAFLLFQAYPHVIPNKLNVDRFVPTIFGFKVHEYARIERWQGRRRNELLARLEEYEDEERNPK